MLAIGAGLLVLLTLVLGFAMLNGRQLWMTLNLWLQHAGLPPL